MPTDDKPGKPAYTPSDPATKKQPERKEGDKPKSERGKGAGAVMTAEPVILADVWARREAQRREKLLAVL